jgi:Asp-tRNA(Asn)/Glu-tRNA(Gln) amidotransferase A subunit family amidase
VIAELARLVRDRQVSCVELVGRSLALVEAGARLGAVVALRPEQALAEAAEQDRRLAAGEELGPLAGLPLLVKDLEDVAGMVTTQGSLVYADTPPAEADGRVPGRLRAAGAVVVGKTNLPECAFEAYTSNRLYGPTRNPWDLRYSPGGSSGGSAAALSAGMVPLATATDGGGSARIPAAFCGLVGLKPTNGIVGRSPVPSWMDLSTDGPMGHTVADVRLLLALEKGPVAGDPSALPRWEPGPPGELRRVLASPRTSDWGALDPALQAAFDAALAALEGDLGLPVELVGPARVTPAGNADLDWFTLCCTEQAHQIGADVLRDRADDFDPVLLAQMQAGLQVPLADYLDARRRRFAHVRALDLLLGDDVVLVTPTLTMTAQHADGRMLGAGEPGTPADALNTCLQNITGHPSVSVPAGRLPDGLPFGLLLTGPRYRDDLLLDLAARWEQARPWPWYAPGFEPLLPQPR